MLPEGFSLREATNADRDAVRRLVYDVLAEYKLDPDPGHADRGLEDIETGFASGWLKILVAPDGLLAGTVGMHDLGEGRCELVKMFLAPAFRGQGLGRALLTHFLEEARLAGFTKVELETDTVLKEAIGLYEAAGFVHEKVPNKTPRCNKVMALKLS